MISPWEGVRGMIVRIYTGDDGQTHFEDLPLPAEGSHNLDRMTWSSPTTSQARGGSAAIRLKPTWAQGYLLQLGESRIIR